LLFLLSGAAGVIAIVGFLLREIRLPLLQASSINAYRAAMGTGVVIAVAGALVAFLGIRDPHPAR
jgi:hypothetical protein